MKRSALIAALAALQPFPSANPSLEQVGTPPEAAAELLLTAVARDDLVGRSILDLGCGTGVLSIGAALLGACEVTGVEVDPVPLRVARENAERARVSVTFEESTVADWAAPSDTVVMNPPFGAQRRGADRPFWDQAFALARRSIYAFALRPSRTFIQRRAVARAIRIEETRPIDWTLPRTFPHHRKPRVAIEVDLWVFTKDEPP